MDYHTEVYEGDGEYSERLFLKKFTGVEDVSRSVEEREEVEEMSKLAIKARKMLSLNAAST